MSTLQLFDFEGHQIDWGKDEQGNPVCEARQLGKVLGFSASYVPEVVSRIYPQFKFQSAMGKPGRPAWYLREPGIYQMIFESKSDIAQRFQCWVFEEVLPKLRSSAGYLMPTATTEQLGALQKQINDQICAIAKLKDDLMVSEHMLSIYGWYKEKNTAEDIKLFIQKERMEALEENYQKAKTAIANHVDWDKWPDDPTMDAIMRLE